MTQPSTSTIDMPGMARLREHFRAGYVHETTIFPGLLLLGGFAGLLFLRSPLRWPLLFTSLGIWMLTLGSSLKLDGRFVVEPRVAHGATIAWLPYAAFFEIPGLASLRSPNRSGFALAAVLAAATGMTLAWLFGRFREPWQRAAMTVGAGMLLATNLVIPIHTSGLTSSPAMAAAFREVAELARPGETMILVPDDCTLGTHTVLFQILHRTPLVGCQTSKSAIAWSSSLELYRHSAALAGLRCNPKRLGPVETSFTKKDTFDPHALRSLRRELGVRFFLLDRNGSTRCAHVRQAAELLETYRTLGADRQWILIDTGPVATGAPPG